MDHQITPLTKIDAAQVAELHRVMIGTGFLSSLGRGFLTQLYKAIGSCPAGFGFVCKDGPTVQGFIACSESTGRLYKQAMLRRGLLMALPLVRFMVRPATMRRLFETLKYPSETTDLPPAELLSIAVSPTAQSGGIGKALVAAANDEFRRRGIKQYRVAVWAENTAANRFYQKCGFKLAMQKLHHGLEMNIYVLELRAAQG